MALENNIKVLSGDLFNALEKEEIKGKIQMVISNPPYISREIVKSLDSRVRDYEPTLALDGGIDGLDFYRSIIMDSVSYLKKGGMLIFETGYDQTEEVAELMRLSENFSHIERFKDYGGNFRGVSGIYKGDN